MLKNDIDHVDTYFHIHKMKAGETPEAWGRIKKYLEESCKQPITQVETTATPAPVGEICSDHKRNFGCVWRSGACSEEPCIKKERKLLST